MKKPLALVLMLASLSAFSTTVFAENTTTLTTTVPDATYTLNIPADQEITFGATSTNIGNVTVTDSSGFAEGKDLQVTVDYEAFSCDDVSTTIPYQLYLYSEGALYTDTIKRELPSGAYFTFRGNSNGSTEEEVWLRDDPNLSNGFWQRYMDYLQIDVTSESWGKALAGNYSTTITFTSEVVVSE